MAKEPQKFKGWKDELQSIINANLTIRDNGKTASNKTQSDRATFLFAFFHMLREKGYAVSPCNLKQKHIQVACDYCVFLPKSATHNNRKKATYNNIKEATHNSRKKATANIESDSGCLIRMTQ